MPKYFSQQTGVRKRFDLAALRDQLQGIYQHFEGHGYFAEYFGTLCQDAPNGHLVGKAGYDIPAFVFAHTQRRDLYPVTPSGRPAPETPWLPGTPWTEDQIFDTIQFLATIVSMPTETKTHDYFSHTHYLKFHHQRGFYEYREMINNVLANYGDGPGWKLGLEPDLAISALAPTGLEPLVASVPAASLDADSRSRVSGAIDKFHTRAATMDDKRDAVTALGGILEKYKDETKDLFSKSTLSNIFNLLNNFNLRHNNDKQFTDYGETELSAMFYHTLNLVQLLARKQEEQQRQ